MENKSGGVLLSHAVARVVSSARQGLTTEFGMDRVWPLRYELSAFSYQRSAKGGMRFTFPPYCPTALIFRDWLRTIYEVVGLNF